jgi:hypothetical protein
MPGPSPAATFESTDDVYVLGREARARALGMLRDRKFVQIDSYRQEVLLSVPSDFRTGDGYTYLVRGGDFQWPEGPANAHVMSALDRGVLTVTEEVGPQRGHAALLVMTEGPVADVRTVCATARPVDAD